MVDLKAERYTFRQAADRVQVHVATIWRWTLTGVRGRKLPTFHIGGRRYVLRSDLETFLAGDPASGDLLREQQPDPRAASAGAQLDELFVTAGRRP